MDVSVLPSLISAGAVLSGAALQQAFSLLGKRAEQREAHRSPCGLQKKLIHLTKLESKEINNVR